MAINSASEPLYLLVAEAHQAIVLHEDSKAEALIDSMIARLQRAKEAVAQGEPVTAVREFDARYQVRS